jgi:hypothetical protein
MDGFRLLDTGHGNPADTGALRDLLRSASLRKGIPRIRCPRCCWRPDQSSRWLCSCGTVWNTFLTGGLCPGCAHQWSRTMCLACQRWSLHDDWYERSGEPGPEA